MAAFAAGVASERPVFLADPVWGAAERAALGAMIQSSVGPKLPVEPRGWLMIPSGGSGGKLKFARHDQDTVAAAVLGFSRHFAVDRIHSLGVLPLHHVSGLMAWMRAALTGGSYLPWDWKRLEAGERPFLSSGPWFLSVVPTQLQRLLGSPGAIEWLRGFQAVFVGGGPVWPALAAAAAEARLPISLSYGTTETAAMAAALRPDEFLAGGRSCGLPLPHAQIDLTAEGVVRIAGESVFHGYFPDRNFEARTVPPSGGSMTEARQCITGDLGRIDKGGRLSILGRRDALVITGGKKVDPSEVEAALWATGEFSDLAVVGVPDPEWGEALVACYPADQKPPDLARVAAGCADLAGFKRPRRYLAVSEWPRNAQGKVNRLALLAAIRG
jgi:O-succinylbenzoic acid--CoA ligase